MNGYRFWLLAASCVFGCSLMLGCTEDPSFAPSDAGRRSDAAGDAAGDAPLPLAPCPPDSPEPDNQAGACCYRKSNADQLGAPELRLASIEITAPTSLSSIIVGGLISDALDDERFNWLVRIEGADADGDVTLTTGYGARDAADGTFSFTDGAAPAPGDPDRWNPIMTTGSLAGETVSAPAFDGTFTVPIFDSVDPTLLVLELPLQNFELTMATLSELRSCIGYRRPTSYYNGDASLVAFMAVDDADAGRLTVGTTIDSTLCMFIAGMSGELGKACVDFPDRTMWMFPPDSMCNAGVCAKDTGDGSLCGPTTCNAWELRASFSAQGVEIN